MGKLFDWLKQEGLYDDTLIVFTADHGEEFYEHGGWWHGLTLYDEQIHVPLMFKMAGQAQAGSIDTALARSLDIAPTIIRQAGFDVPEVMQGLDLMGQTGRAELVYSEEDHEGNILRSVRGAQWKLVEANTDNPRGLEPLSLFHVAEDPQEMQNLSQTQANKASELQAHLDQVSSLAVAQAVTGSQQELDEETLQLLKKSGY
jgi:arylsulfatase A-like enzyme